MTLRLRLESVARFVVSWYNSARKPRVGIKREARYKIVVQLCNCERDMLTCSRLLQLLGWVPVMLLLPRSSELSCSTATALGCHRGSCCEPPKITDVAHKACHTTTALVSPHPVHDRVYGAQSRSEYVLHVHHVLL